jgi:hypothetical protein
VHDTATPAAFVRDVAGNGFNANGQILSRNTSFGGGTPTNLDSVSLGLRCQQADGTYANTASIRGQITDVTNNVCPGAFIVAVKQSGNPASVFDSPAFVVSIQGFGYHGFSAFGSTVTQATSKATGVTLNFPTGTIVTHNATLNAGASVSFVFTNSRIAATDTIIVNVQSAGVTADTYSVAVGDVASGSCRVRITNYSATNRGEAVTINYAIVKAVNN